MNDSSIVYLKTELYEKMFIREIKNDVLKSQEKSKSKNVSRYEPLAMWLTIFFSMISN